MNNQSFFDYLTNSLMKKAYLDTAMEETNLFLAASAKINESNPTTVSDVNLLKNDLTLLQARLSTWHQNQAHTDSRTANTEITKLQYDFIQFTERVKELPNQGYTGFGKIDVKEPIKGLNNNQNSPDKVTKFALSFGVASFISLIGLSLIFTQWTDTNPILFRTLLAMAAACIAVSLPGLLNLNFSNIVKASGSLGVFALVYFINPPDQKKEFDLLVNLTLNEDGVTVPVKGKEDELTLQVAGNDYKSDGKVTEKGEVYFRNIPISLYNKSANFIFISKYYKLKNPVITCELKSESVTIDVVPKLIEQISGVVQSVNGVGIEGAKVTVENSPKLVTYTTESGTFKLPIPKESQKPKLSVTVSKEGYQYSEGNNIFQSEFDLLGSQKVTVYLIKKLNTGQLIPPKPVPTGGIKQGTVTSTGIVGSTSTSSNETTYIPLVLKYEHKKTPFLFPVDNTINVQQLRDYVCEDEKLAMEYANNKIQCQIKSFGGLLPLDKKLKDLNLAANTEISLECNGFAIPMKRFYKITIKGKNFLTPIVYINGRFINLQKNNTGSVAPSLINTDKTNEVVIYDSGAKKKYVYNNVKIPYDLYVDDIVFNVINDKMTAYREPTRVVLYDKQNYAGEAYPIYGEKETQLTDANTFNDRAVSIKIPRGFKVRFYDDVNKKGDFIELTENCPDLSLKNMSKKISYVEIITDQLRQNLDLKNILKKSKLKH